MAPARALLAKQYNTVAVAGNGCCRFCIDCMHLCPKRVRGKLGGFLGKASAGIPARQISWFARE